MGSELLAYELATDLRENTQTPTMHYFFVLSGQNHTPSKLVGKHETSEIIAHIQDVLYIFIAQYRKH